MCDMNQSYVTCRQQNAGWTALFDACMSGVLEPTKLLIAAGIDVNAQRTSGATPLFIACLYGKKESVETVQLVTCLLHSKADADGNISMGKIPLIEAAGRGCVQVVNALLQHGANANITRDGVTAYSRANDEGHEEMMQILLAAGAVLEQVVDPGNLATGSQLQAYYTPTYKWYDAQITAKNDDGTYEIAWNDGDTKDTHNKTIEELMMLASQLSPEHLALLAAGDDVTAFYKNSSWYTGKIADMSDGNVTVNWDDRDSQDRVKVIRQVRFKVSLLAHRLT